MRTINTAFVHSRAKRKWRRFSGILKETSSLSTLREENHHWGIPRVPFGQTDGNGHRKTSVNGQKCVVSL